MIMNIFTLFLNICKYLEFKALHSKLLTELSSRFSSRNEFFVISEVQV